MAQHPRATYRLQLTSDFGFDAAALVVPYLTELGVSHLYSSPVLQAVKGSTHGYDVVDHERVSEDLGGSEGHVRLRAALDRAGLGQILDIVPNHMAIGTRANKLWWDVLENGPASEVASFFDVDWDASKDNRILLPILGEHYFEALEQKLVKVAREGERFLVRYYDHVIPAAPRSIAPLLRDAAPGDDELAFWADSLEDLPAPWATDRESTARRSRHKSVIYANLKRLFTERRELAGRVDAALAELNENIQALDVWLDRQNWRITYWKNATTELGYRRFFDVNTLAGLRMEERRVFDRSHRLILQWLRDRTLDGLRIDHVDGLRDPEEYLRWLRDAAPDAYLIVEKILNEHECMPRSWPVEGTTGYEFARLIDQLMVDPDGEVPMTEFVARFADQSASFSEMVHEAKLQILRNVLASEREHLVDQTHRMLMHRIELRDCTRRTVHAAMTELLASYPVYRTYLRRDQPAAAHDLEMIHGVIARAAERLPEIEPKLWSVLEQALTLSLDDDLARDVALRVQQVTGAITAKAVEDTVFYRHVRLTALNEVGGTPEQFGITVDEFHRQLVACKRPHSMLASATHDTKRGEDTRARLLVLSEIPTDWERAVMRWSARSERYRDPSIPRTTEYFFYQTVVGAHPLTAERAWQYMQKAIREAKQQTSWIDPNEAFEAAVERFVNGMIGDRELMDDVARFVATIEHAGYLNSLSRTLLKLTAPGVPDIYQGTELWDFSLVDPDNRRPVDFEQRRTLLARLPSLSPEQVLAEMAQGTPKLWLTWKALQLRARRPSAFDSDYRPLPASGRDAASVIAFARDDTLITVVPRLVARGELRDRDARIPVTQGSWQDVLTGQRFTGDEAGLQVGSIWARFPVALLERQT
jgi:(1->4)-alpha-D-glucan 1-alpha-D-glucosylmutase